MPTPPRPTTGVPGVLAPLRRRSFVTGLAGAGGLAGLAACSDASTGASGSGGPSQASADAVTFGLNANAAIPTAGYDAVFGAFTAETGIDVATNRLLYTEQVNNYLQSAPDDVLIWNAGYRMRFFAGQGLVSDLTGVWDEIGDGISDGVRQACTAEDGGQYLVPFYTYPWVVYYRPSLFAERGYSVPTTLNELNALGTAMQGDGLTPFAFADQEGWEAMGTFDIINMRINGYDFHISLLDGAESWTDDRVRETFRVWESLLPLHQDGALGRTWQDAAASLQQGESAMYLMGSFMLDQFEGADRDDLDFFAFPEIEAEHGQDGIDAPIDGFMMVGEPDNREGSEELLRYLGTGAAQDIYLQTDANTVGVAGDIDTGAYSVLQQKFAEVIAASPDVAQYLDRDTRPDFAAPAVIPALQAFIEDPSRVEELLEQVQQQAEATFSD